MKTGVKVNPDAAIDMDTLLASTPLRNQSVQWERRSETELIARIPIRKKWYMGPPLSWVMPFSSHRIVALDTLGSEVLQACDGVNTIEQIVERFAAAHHLRFHQARLSVMEFLRQLTRRGLIAVAGPRREEIDP